MLIQSVEDIFDLMKLPLLELLTKAAQVHAKHQQPNYVQLSHLISIKTGGCPEDCSYCPQSARYRTAVKRHRLMTKEQVLEIARAAKADGVSRICMGAAWREVKEGPEFDQVLEMVHAVGAEGVEVCCTLGMLTFDQAKRLKQAGLTAYNHNLDSSRSFYEKIISTRVYDQRIETLKNVRSSNLSVCSGGIIGMGESEEDRAQMLWTLLQLDPSPESVPINSLVPVEGTPLGKRSKTDPWALIKMIAVTRLVLPKTMVRLSAGRSELSDAEQALCFLAGANSVFSGEKLLTTPNVAVENDRLLFAKLGIHHDAR